MEEDAAAIREAEEVAAAVAQKEEAAAKKAEEDAAAIREAEEVATAVAQKVKEEAKKAEEDAAAIREAEEMVAAEAQKAEEDAVAAKVNEDTATKDTKDEMAEIATKTEVTMAVATIVAEESNKAKKVVEMKVADGQTVKEEKQLENLEGTSSNPADTPSISVQYYTLEELKAGVPGVDYAKREQYLADDVFLELFGMKKDQFLQLQTWKRVAAKKGIGLF